MGFIVIDEKELLPIELEDLFKHGAFRIRSDYAIILKNPTQFDYDYFMEDPEFWRPLSKRVEMHCITSSWRDFNEKE